MNVALLVPMSRRTLRMGLVDALSAQTRHIMGSWADWWIIDGSLSSPPGSVVRFDPGGGAARIAAPRGVDRGYRSYEFVRVVFCGASVGALTDFGGVGRGGQG